MKRPRFSLAKSDCSDMAFIGQADALVRLRGGSRADARLGGRGRPPVLFLSPSLSNRLMHHLFVDGHHTAALGWVELHSADHAAERLAQRSRAEAFLPRGFPGDGDER